jgi:hypothetical protein
MIFKDEAIILNIVSLRSHLKTLRLQFMDFSRVKYPPSDDFAVRFLRVIFSGKFKIHRYLQIEDPSVCKVTP